MPFYVHWVSLISIIFMHCFYVYLVRKYGVHSENAFTTMRKTNMQWRSAGESKNIIQDASRDHTHLTHLQSHYKASQWFHRPHTPGFSLTIPPLFFYPQCPFCLHLGAFVDVIVWIVLHISPASVEVPLQNSRMNYSNSLALLRAGTDTMV